MKTLRIGLIIVVATVGLAVNSARANQPHMTAALEHLRAARAELKMAEHNKGGWRVVAIANVDKAIADVERGMAAAR
jgi:hypothetical protein